MHPETKQNGYRIAGFLIGVVLLIAALWGIDDGDPISVAQESATTTTTPTTAPGATPTTAAVDTGPKISGLSGEAQVKAVQDRLNALGYDSGVADGIAGPPTVSALEAFQKANGIAVTGEINEVTIEKLDSDDPVAAN